MIDICYRTLNVGDISEIYELEKISFSNPWSYEMIEEECLNYSSHYMVAYSRNDNKIVGYIGLYTVLDEATIINIAVHPDYRRMGIGTTLLDLMVKKCEKEDVKTLFLEVREGSIPARNLYKRMGFEEIYIRKAYYDRPIENAIIMKKII